MEKIKAVAGRFKLLVIFMAIVYPLWELIIWTYAHQMPLWIVGLNEIEILGNPVENRWQRFYCWLSEVPSAIVWIYMMLVFYRVLSNYEKLEIFSLQNARYYEKLGVGTCLFMLCIWLSNVCINFIFSMQTTFWGNILSEMELIYIMGVMIGVGIILVGWVMQEAYKIADEGAKII